jgi:hypothetical protein
VLYCSEACLTEAAEKYHFTECPVLRQLFAMYQRNDEKNVAALTVRILSMIGVDKWREFVTSEASTCTTSGIKGFNTEGQYISSSLIALYNLASNIPEADTKMVLTHCITTIQIMKCLGLDKDPNYNEFAGSVLQLHVSTFCNCIGYVLSFLEESSVEEIEIARSVALGFSLFNHSCSPNAAYFFSGSHIIVRTLEPIKKGEQVTISYKHDFFSTPKIDRINYLKEAYFFNCECKACIQSWPLFEYLPTKDVLSLELMQELNELNMKALSKYKYLLDCDSDVQKQFAFGLDFTMEFLNRLHKKGNSFNQVYFQIKNELRDIYRRSGTYYRIDH